MTGPGDDFLLLGARQVPGLAADLTSSRHDDLVETFKRTPLQLFNLLPYSDDMDGPTVYGLYLYPEVGSSDAGETHRKAVAEALWSKREERRRRYQEDWGDVAQWPAQHPTTVIALGAPTAVRAAVCVRCFWVAGKSDEVVDLHAQAKAHAVEHPHDSALDRGENPPKLPRPVPDLARRFDEARANARRAARRVALRGND